ncbi:MAG: response regulator [Verrucomicrobiia bacterium]|jgi:two-component system phosphate regulon response regulator PhoB
MNAASIRARILVVDDEAAIREYETSLLSELGHEVLTAADGAEALRLACERRPHLVLLDIMMPELSGIEVCRQLRADPRTRDTRIIMVSAVDAKRALEESIIAGADDFLAKPVHALELMVRVRSILRVRNILDEEERLEAYVKNLQAMRCLEPTVS